jgi:hypothetical protein
VRQLFDSGISLAVIDHMALVVGALAALPQTGAARLLDPAHARRGGIHGLHELADHRAFLADDAAEHVEKVMKFRIIWQMLWGMWIAAPGCSGGSCRQGRKACSCRATADRK